MAAMLVSVGMDAWAWSKQERISSSSNSVMDFVAKGCEAHHDCTNTSRRCAIGKFCIGSGFCLDRVKTVVGVFL